MSKARDIANSGTALGSVSPTELGYLDGVTSAVQTQINAKEATLPSQTGNSGKYLTTNGSTKSWGTVSAGPILQVVYGSTLTTASTSSNSFVDTNLTATITPTSASSKILVMVSQNGGYSNAQNNYATGLIICLFRSTTNLAYLTSGWNYDGNYHEDRGASFSISYVDSPATTSSTTYKTQFRNRYPAAAVSVQEGGETSTIVLMEIAG